MRRILVAGATGQLGQSVLQALLNSEWNIRVLVRSPKKWSLDGVEVVQGDLSRPESLKGCCEGVDVVFSCAGASMALGGLFRRDSFYKIDHQGNRALLNEAEAAGVQRFVYVSLSAADKLRHTEYADAHERFVEDLQKSSLTSCIVRPTGFYSFLGELLTMARMGIGMVMGPGHFKTNPIHQDDVARACIEALETEAGELEVGGPAAWSRTELVELAFQALQRKPRILHMPAGLLRVMILPLRLLNRRLYALMHFGIEVSLLDCKAPQYGTKKLPDYFAEKAEK